MKIQYTSNVKQFNLSSFLVVAAFSKEVRKGKKFETVLDVNHWDAALKKSFKSTKISKTFLGNKGTTFSFTDSTGRTIFVLGMGNKLKMTSEGIRRGISGAYKAANSANAETLGFDIGQFERSLNVSEILKLSSEAILLTGYKFETYKKSKSKNPIKTVKIYSKKKIADGTAKKILKLSHNIAESVNLARDYANEVPNVLTSEKFAKEIVKDVRSNLKRVKVKVLTKLQIKKEKMNLLLAVNAGSVFEPRLVHLTYTPTKTSGKTKHIALVGKGLTFDSGGYSLKPSNSIAGMKNDMAGASTVYGAFRAAVMSNSPNKLTCIIPMTDNLVSGSALLPDSVIIGRNGKSVEIKNTDAEGRLILADALDYACDLKVDEIIDAATLTGAAVRSLGTEMCACFGNKPTLIGDLLKSTANEDEYMWEMPMIEEWRKDFDSSVADMTNSATKPLAGSSKAAIFLREFVKKDIAWVHLDIAGVACSQPGRPYCPPKGASGLMVRPLINYIMKK